MPLTPIIDMQLLRPKSGDRIVLTSSIVLTPEQIKSIIAAIGTAWDGYSPVPVIYVPPGIKLSVVEASTPTCLKCGVPCAAETLLADGICVTCTLDSLVDADAKTLKELKP